MNSAKLFRPNANSIGASGEFSKTGWMLICSSTFLVLGLVLPTLKVEKFFFFGETHSVLSLIYRLFSGGNIFIGAVVLIFSVVFPAWKLLTLGRLFVSPIEKIKKPHLKRLELIGKWSMLDVFILALIIVSMKGKAFADATALPGAYFFAASVFLAMFASGKIVTALEEKLIEQN